MASANRQRVTGHYSMQRTPGRNVDDELYANTSYLRTVKPKYRSILSNHISNNRINLLDGYYDGFYNYKNNIRIQFNDLITYLLRQRETSDNFSVSHCNFVGVRETFSRLMSLALLDQCRLNVFCQKVGNTIYILDEKCPVENPREFVPFERDAPPLRTNSSHEIVGPVRILKHSDPVQGLFDVKRSVTTSNSTAQVSRANGASASSERHFPTAVRSTTASVDTVRTYSAITNAPPAQSSQYEMRSSQSSHQSSPLMPWNHFNYAKTKLKQILTDYFDPNISGGSFDALSAQSFYNVYEKVILSPDKQNSFRILYNGEIDATLSNDHFYDANSRSQSSVLLRMRLSPNRKFPWHAKQKKFTEWWSNAYLSGVNNVIVAHHSPSFSVDSLECYDLEHLNLMSGGQRRRDVCLDHFYYALSEINDLMRHAKNGEMYQFTYPREGYARNYLQVFEESKKLLNADVIYRMS